MNINKISFLILCLFLAGCKLGPSYHRPPVPIPDTFQYESEEAEDSLNLAWWRQFNDPVLEGYIDEALVNNQNIKIATANIKNAVGMLIQTRAPLFPQLGYAGDFTRTKNSSALSPLSDLDILPNVAPASVNKPQTIWEALLNGSWEIDLWGKTLSLVDAAEANISAAKASKKQVVLSLITSVANSYIKLLGLDEQLAISIRTMEAYKEEVDYFEKQFKYGQVSAMAVAQADTQYEGAAAKIPVVQEQIVQVENALNVLLGRNPGPIKRGSSIYTLDLPTIPADLPSELLNQRPDILLAEEQLVGATANIGAATALYFPSISLTGFYGNASPQLHKLFTGPAGMWNYSGSITGPIFTGGAIYGQVKQTYAQREEALHNYRLTIQQAFANVENALNAHTMTQQELVSQKKLVEAAGEYVKLATLQYKSGYSPYFVVIQAQEQYFPAELGLAQTRAQLFTTMVNIYQSMGGGWVDIAESISDEADCASS